MPKTTLDAGMFREWPVWSESDSGEFARVEAYDPLPTDLGDLYLRVTLQTPGGVVLDGVLVATPNRHFCGVFIDDNMIPLNVAMRSDDHQIKRLSEAIEKRTGRHLAEGESLFPLDYKTSFAFRGEPKIEGSFVVVRRAKLAP